MRKSSKKQAILLCSAALALSLSIGVPTLLTKAENPDLTATEGKFYVVDGASVKIDAIGIRFTTVVEKGYYEAVRAAYPNAEFHTEFYDALTDGLLQDAKYTHGLEYCANSAVNMSNTAKDVDGYQYHVSMEYDELEELYQKLALGYELYAKSYVLLDGTTKIYAESNEVVRSMKQVAELASADDVAGLEQYYENVYLNDGVEYYEKAVTGETVAVNNLPAETTETGALTAYIGTTALTDVTFGAGTVNFGDETLAKLTAGEIYRLTVVGETQGVWSAPFKCITKFTDNETFVTDMEAYKSDASAYLMLSEDVALDDTDFDNATNGTYMVWNTRYVFDAFAATLDGNGKTVKIAYDEIVYCGGLIQGLSGTVKNLVYDYCATYIPRLTTTYGNDQPRAFFVFALQDGAAIENCFVNVDVTSVYGGAEIADPLSALFMQYFGNSASGVSVKNNIFAYKVNGVDSPIMGYSVTQNAFFHDSVFLTTAGVGDNLIVALKDGNGGQAIGLQNCYVYPTVEDYLAGTNGMYASKTIFSNKVGGNGAMVEATGTQYDVLNASKAWKITAEKISLCGTKVYPEDRLLTATIVGNTLTVTDSQFVEESGYDVYVGEEKVGSFTGTSCDVLEVLKGKLVAGENNVTVTVKTASGVAAETTATATYIGLTQENFLSTVNTSETTDYMVMLENVSVGEEDYLSTTLIWGYYYGIDLVQGTLDGLGHKISVTVDIYNRKAGLFKEISGTLKNLEYEITATYLYDSNQTNKGFFAFNTKQSTFENCYIHAKVTAYTTTAGTLTCTDTEAALIATAQNGVNASATTGNGSFKYCIFDMKRYDTEAEKFVDGKLTDKSSYNMTTTNCVFLNVGEGGAALFGTFAATNPGYKAVLTNCVKYATFDAFLKGENGTLCEGVYKNETTSATYTYAETAIASGNAWSVLNESSAWKVTATGITLCGVSIYTVEA
ncbi:MAG: hypothetical protein IJX81_03970 [Clostridia bacterium]|nr:hypothetical protein [Clostridia bacterium]